MKFLMLIASLAVVSLAVNAYGEDSMLNLSVFEKEGPRFSQMVIGVHGDADGAIRIVVSFEIGGRDRFTKRDSVTDSIVLEHAEEILRAARLDKERFYKERTIRGEKIPAGYVFGDDGEVVIDREHIGPTVIRFGVTHDEFLAIYEHAIKLGKDVREPWRNICRVAAKSKNINQGKGAKNAKKTEGK